VSPGTAGFNTFTARVTDYDAGSPVNASSVELEFTNPLRPQLGESTLTLKRQAAGTFAARGANLSIAGVWEVAAIIENANSSAEVHLQLTTIGPAPSVTASPFQGLPTLYSIQLQSGWLAQVYLDPDKPGADEFHVTFFTNANETSELQIASVTIGMTIPGGTPTILVPTRLDPIGHFVAAATVPAGPTRFDIIATTQSGVAITTYVTITPGS
jgi:hypothetical protein